MADRKFGIETLCLHAGQIPDAATGARAAPIYQTTSFVFDSADHAASLFNLQTFGNVYSRISNPTVAVFEERMAALENGRAALGCATGQAAEVVAILTLCKGGDHIVSASTLYGGTHTLLGVNLRKLGVETTFVAPDDPRYVATVDAIGAALRHGHHLFRYVVPDDFGAPETSFTICSFWYADALAAIGRLDEARALFEQLLAERNPLGLLSEDIHPGSGELWGNFPQTYSLVGLINTAMRLSRSWESML